MLRMVLSMALPVPSPWSPRRQGWRGDGGWLWCCCRDPGERGRQPELGKGPAGGEEWVNFWETFRKRISQQEIQWKEIAKLRTNTQNVTGWSMMQATRSQALFFRENSLNNNHHIHRATRSHIYTRLFLEKIRFSINLCQLWHLINHNFKCKR